MDAPVEPIGPQDNLQFAEEVSDIEALRFEFGIGLLLCLPEVEVLVLCSEPSQRKDAIDIVLARPVGRGGRCPRGANSTTAPLREDDPSRSSAPPGKARHRFPHLRWQNCPVATPDQTRADNASRPDQPPP